MKSLALKNIARRIMKFLCISVFTLVFFSVFLPQVKAATLIFSPSIGSYNIGSYFTVSVLVSSPDKVMNAASGVISFPNDLLSVSSISETSSIFNVWPQAPSYSNTDGTINFQGAVLPPWYTGNSGKLITVTFKAKAEGTANLSFISGSVLAADGMGTNITSSFGTAAYQISKGNVTQPVTLPPAENETPPAPQISSDTYSDQTKWYALTTADFSWPLTTDIIGDSLLIGRLANSSPTVLYNPPISSKQIPNLNDGVWYFHVQLENAKGWGGVGVYKVQIDIQKPTNFDITPIPNTDITNPIAKFTFSASDKTSGIDHYEVQIDNNPVQNWIDDGSHTYATPDEEGGTHTLLAKAVDKAGNYLANSAQFTIQALFAPIITNYPTEINSGDVLTINGTSMYPNSEVSLFLQDENGAIKNYSSRADNDGNFTVVSSDRLKDGIYIAWVQVTDPRGAKSLLSDKVTISAKQSTLLKIGTLAVNYLTVSISLLALILLLILMLWYAWRKFFIIGDKIKKETREAEDALHKAFDFLKDSVERQLEILEKAKAERSLTPEEEKINSQLREAIDFAEQYVMKEIKDIDDLVNKKK